MWSVHTRNETTSAGTPPEMHAETCRLERAGTPRGEVWAHIVEEEEEKGGESLTSGGGEKRRGGGGGGLARRLALYGSYVGVGALRLPQCALYSPTLKESHALTSSSSTRHGFGGPQR